MYALIRDLPKLTEIIESCFPLLRFDLWQAMYGGCHTFSWTEVGRFPGDVKDCFMGGDLFSGYEELCSKAERNLQWFVDMKHVAYIEITFLFFKEQKGLWLIQLTRRWQQIQYGY